MISMILDKLNGHAKEGKVCKIHVNEGDSINPGDLMFDIECSKGNFQVKSIYKGTIKTLKITDGIKVKIGDTLAEIEGELVNEKSESKKEEKLNTVSSNKGTGFNYFGGLLKPQKETVQCDIAILGGGPGGYVAAIEAAKRGKKVLLIEKENLGGTCLNFGCIPTKTLVRSAEVYDNLKNAEKFGLYADNVSVDMKKVIYHKDEVVSNLRNGIEYILNKHGVRIVKAEGKLLDENTLFAKEGRNEITIKAENIILATGSKTSMLPIKGADSKHVITSTEALSLSELPESLVIIGGGIIGMEFAFIYAKLGVKVSVVEYFNNILFNLDEDIIEEISSAAYDSNIKLYTGSKVQEILNEEADKCIVVFEKDGEKKYLSANKVLMAVGRCANFEGIGIENAKIELTDNKKAIKVNNKMQTNIDHIYAIGDVTGKMQLAHVASHQGIVAVKNILGEETIMDYSVVPGAIFTHPEIATVGISEKEALNKGIEIEVGKFPFAANGKALTYGETEGFVKLIKDKNSSKIIGGAIIGPHATDLIAEVALAIKNNLTACDIIETIHAHPTTAEALHESALALEGGSIHFVS